MRTILTAMILAVATLHGYAQIVAGNFLPRANDEVTLLQTAYVAADEGAEDTVWDFRQLEISGNEYPVCYAEEEAYDGLTVGTAFNTRHYYSTISDAEIEAYKMQFSYNRSFPGFCKNLNDINVHSVGNITDSTGKPIYYQIYKYSIYLKELEKIKSEK